MGNTLTIRVRLFGVDLPLLETTEIAFSVPPTVEEILKAFLETGKLADSVTLKQLGQSIFLFNQQSLQLTDTVTESGELYILRPLGGG